MEASRTAPNEGLPSETAEAALSEQLPETRPKRLEKLGTLLRRKNTPEAPPEPPPITLEQLITLEPALAEETVGVDVDIEEVALTEAEQAEARERLEAVFEAAAEADAAEEELEMPEEAQYERRAEIKRDQPASSVDDGLATSIGQILADLHQKTATAHAAFSKISVPKRWRPQLSIFTSQPKMYRQAMLAGFAGACVLLGIFVLISSV